MMSSATPLFRDRIVSRLVEDLVGPLAELETLTDRPTQRYSTGILYPTGSRIEPEEDQDRGLESWPETLVDLASGYTPGNQG